METSWLSLREDAVSERALLYRSLLNKHVNIWEEHVLPVKNACNSKDFMDSFSGVFNEGDVENTTLQSGSEEVAVTVAGLDILPKN